MAFQTIQVVQCDRCGKKMADGATSRVSETQTTVPLILIQRAALEVSTDEDQTGSTTVAKTAAQWFDLCTRCEKSVVKLMGLLLLTRPKPKARTKKTRAPKAAKTATGKAFPKPKKDADTAEPNGSDANEDPDRAPLAE